MNKEKQILKFVEYPRLTTIFVLQVQSLLDSIFHRFHLFAFLRKKANLKLLIFKKRRTQIKKK